MSFQPLIFNGFVIGQSSGGGSSPTIGGPVVGGLSGSVLFVNPNATLAQDNANFNFNDSTHALTISGIFSASNVSGNNTGDVTLGTTNGLSIAGQVLSLQLSSGFLTGALSSTDWNTFNNKQNAFTSQSANLFYASPNGSSGIASFRSIFATDLPNLSATYVTQSEVGTSNGVASLDSGGKIPVGQLPSSVMEYQGAWNPNTNTPSLSDGTGTNGNVYYVTAARLAAVSGLTDPSMVNFQIGDLVIYSSSVGKWQLTTPAAGVQSVNGFQGAVVLTQGDLTDVGTDGITVNNGTNAVWGSGTSLAQHVADTTHNGYLASTDWNTFNSKQSSLTFGSISTSTTGVSVGSGTNSTVGPNVTVNIQTASGSQPGLLSSADWTTFNNKQPAGSYITALTGDVVASGPGSASSTIQSNVVSNTKLAQMSTLTLKGNNTGSLANASDLTVSQVQTMLSITPGSSGDLTQNSFIAADNQSSPADITGFAFANGSVRSFDALVSITRNNTYATYKILGIQRAADWIISSTFSGDATGIAFSITNAGQLQYTSTSTGFTAKIAFRAQVTNV